LKIKFYPPAPTHINKFNNCKDAICIPPIASDAYNNELTKQSARVIERLSHIKPGKNVFQTKLPKHLQLNIKGAKSDEGQQLQTPISNSILGRYFLYRLGVPLGAKVEDKHLKEYGQDYVVFTKIDDETFQMDFSKRKK